MEFNVSQVDHALKPLDQEMRLLTEDVAHFSLDSRVLTNWASIIDMKFHGKSSEC